MAWLEQNGGSVHDALDFDEAERVMTAKSSLPKGEPLFNIPPACLISYASIQSSAFGTNIAKTIQAVMREEADNANADANNKNNKDNEDKIATTKGFYSTKQDLAIALCLAHLQEASSTTSSTSTTTDDKHDFQLYLNTLPERSTFDKLPRRWPENQLQLWLQGSPLLARVQQQKQGIQRDYDLIRDKWMELFNNHKGEKFPSFDTFSDMLAAVSSRAFAGFGGNHKDNNNTDDDENDKDDLDKNIAMVPLLDLCNHCRGEANTTKNVAYQQAQSSTSSKDKNGCVVVTAHQTFSAGEALRITYGARSNAQLLLNYGFCIPDNVEPDGSSNDFLELDCGDSTAASRGRKKEHTTINDDKEPISTIVLRAGPKAHCFHGFVNALDQYVVKPAPRKGGDPECDEDEFGENEKEFEEWDMDMTCNMMEGEDDDDDDDEEDAGGGDLDNQQSVQRYLQALDSFEKRLEELRGGYFLQGEELDRVMSQPPQEQLTGETTKAAEEDEAKRHAALLVKSELKMIYFTLLVIHRLKDILGGTTAAESDAFETLASHFSKENIQLWKEQANQVASAFVSIRLPTLKR